jgi:circadian clock protein KaiC
MLSPTYINGLDSILYGGLVRPSSMLVAGATGSGRTILCLNSLFAAAKAGEKCFYITILSETHDKLLQIASNYSFFDTELLKNDNFKLLELDKEILTKGDYAILKYFHALIQEKPDRVIIDPVTLFQYISPSFEDDRELSPLEKRIFFTNLLRAFEASNILLIMTADLAGDEIDTSIFSYLSDVVLELGYRDQKSDEANRYISIIKSRGRNYVGGKHDLKLSTCGLVVSYNLPAQKM